MVNPNCSIYLINNCNRLALTAFAIAAMSIYLFSLALLHNFLITLISASSKLYFDISLFSVITMPFSVK